MWAKPDVRFSSVYALLSPLAWAREIVLVRLALLGSFLTVSLKIFSLKTSAHVGCALPLCLTKGAPEAAAAWGLPQLKEGA